MSRLADKQICLVVTGGIAAYKAPDIVRQLKAAGARVQVVMTTAGKLGRFIKLIAPGIVERMAMNALKDDVKPR